MSEKNNWARVKVLLAEGTDAIVPQYSQLDREIDLGRIISNPDFILSLPADLAITALSLPSAAVTYHMQQAIAANPHLTDQFNEVIQAWETATQEVLRHFGLA
jgi:hypothetical protein